MKNKLRIATRTSKLALWQANWVKDQIVLKFPQIEIELLPFKTQGDKILDKPLAEVGGKGLFVKELEEAILRGDADIAVHSMKDVPSELPEGLEIVVIAERTEPKDAFVSNQYQSIQELPAGAIVGTSSLRRTIQLKKSRPDLEFKSLRGNVTTRLSKLDQGEYDAIILAAAGLKRLGLEDRIQEHISIQDSIPAVAQGAIGIETRCDDLEVKQWLEHINHTETQILVTAERAFLSELQGNCQIPIGAYAEIVDNKIHLIGFFAQPDGSSYRIDSLVGDISDPVTLGTKLAQGLIQE